MRTITRIPTITAVLLSATMLAGCATNRTPQFSYDASVPPLPTVQAAVTNETPRPLHVPPAWTVARGGTIAVTPTGRVENANAAADCVLKALGNGLDNQLANLGDGNQNIDDAAEKNHGQSLLPAKAQGKAHGIGEKGI